MTTMAKAVAAVVVVAAGAAIYPSARGAYVRNRAGAHLEEASAMRDSIKSQVGAQSLESAMGGLRLVLRGTASDASTIANADRALVDLMKRLKATPPPNQGVAVTAHYDVTSPAGAVVPVTVTIAPQVDEVFVDSVTVEIGANRGWRTDPVRKDIRQAVRSDQP